MGSKASCLSRRLGSLTLPEARSLNSTSTGRSAAIGCGYAHADHDQLAWRRRRRNAQARRRGGRHRHRHRHRHRNEDRQESRVVRRLLAYDVGSRTRAYWRCDRGDKNMFPFTIAGGAGRGSLASSLATRCHICPLIYALSLSVPSPGPVPRACCWRSADLPEGRSMGGLRREARDMAT